MDLKDWITDVPDFPKKGIIFKDITPLLRDGKAFSYLISSLAERYRGENIGAVAGIESRGFVIGGALAAALGTGFVPIRKKGKLPRRTVGEAYEKEYGPDALEIHEDSIGNENVLIVDDLLATGGTALAAAKLVERLGGRPQFCFVINLSFLNGREKLKGYRIFSLIEQ